jgi:hypothetical protein
MKVRYALPIIDFASAINNAPMPVPMPTIVACNFTDPNCTAPITPLALTVSPQSPITYLIDLRYGFNGSLRITAMNYIPTQYFFGGPLVGTPAGTTDPTDPATPLISGLFITPLSEKDYPFYSGNIPRDMTKGIFGPRLLDCNGDRGAGVTLEVTDPTGRGFALISNVPVFGTPIPVTDGRGVAGYADMTPNHYVADAIAPDGAHYGRTGMVILPNTVTILEIRTDNGGVLGR